jgi:hypothetical protein
MDRKPDFEKIVRALNKTFGNKKFRNFFVDVKKA